jgi:hypothetical protein
METRVEFLTSPQYLSVCQILSTVGEKKRLGVLGRTHETSTTIVHTSIPANLVLLMLYLDNASFNPPMKCYLAEGLGG